MASDPRSISEIVDDVNASDGEAEPEDGDLDATAILDGDAAFVPMPASIAKAIADAPSYAKAREDAQIPPQMTVAGLVGHPIVLVHKRKQTAFLPQDGTSREGYLVLGAYQEDERPFTVWIGQAVLIKELAQLALPFRTTITKRGRSYIFS